MTTTHRDYRLDYARTGAAKFSAFIEEQIYQMEAGVEIIDIAKRYGMEQPGHVRSLASYQRSLNMLYALRAERFNRKLRLLID